LVGVIRWKLGQEATYSVSNKFLYSFSFNSIHQVRLVNGVVLSNLAYHFKSPVKS
jgi:hypothetical protein